MSTSRGTVDRSINKMNSAISEIDLKAGFVDADVDLEAGGRKRKHCPKGSHKSYRTPSGLLRSKPVCRKHRKTRSGKSKKSSVEPKHYKHRRGMASAPRRKSRTRCSKGYYRAGKRCMPMLRGGDEFEGGEFEELSGGSTQAGLTGGLSGGQAAEPTEISGGATGSPVPVEGGSRTYRRRKHHRRMRLGGGSDVEGGSADGSAPATGSAIEGGRHRHHMHGGSVVGSAESATGIEGGMRRYGMYGGSADVEGGELVADDIEGGKGHRRRRPKSIKKCRSGKVRSYRTLSGNMRVRPICVSRKHHKYTSPYYVGRTKCKRGSRRSKKSGRCVRKA